jgi:hypothetical protein
MILPVFPWSALAAWLETWFMRNVGDVLDMLND